MTDGITWQDVLGQIPRPLAAHNATHNRRAVAARLWHTPDEDQPYRIEFELTNTLTGEVVDRWIGHYVRYAATIEAYTGARMQAEKWLQGSALHEIRPRWVRPYKAEKNDHGAP